MQLTGSAEASGDVQAALVARASSGDRDAFALLIDPRADQLLRTARAILRSEAEAHDATQQTLIAAWVHLPSLRDPHRFDAWLQRTLVNECRQQLRRRSRARELELNASAARNRNGSEGSIETMAVRNAFSRLSVEQRHILTVHHLHGVPLAELADQLGIAVGTAKSRLFRARQALERALESEA